MNAGKVKSVAVQRFISKGDAHPSSETTPAIKVPLSECTLIVRKIPVLDAVDLLADNLREDEGGELLNLLVVPIPVEKLGNLDISGRRLASYSERQLMVPVYGVMPSASGVVHFLIGVDRLV
jgi:hypothetical protein